VEDYVLGLDVAVDDPKGVDFVDGLTDLAHDEGDAGLVEGLGLLELVVELSPGAHLEDDVDVGHVVKAAVHLDDVGVVQEHLNLYLADKLLRYLLLVQQFLLNHLQRAREIRVLLPHQVHAPVLPVPELLYPDEVVDSHLARFWPHFLLEVKGSLQPVALKGGLDHLGSLHVDLIAVQERRSLPLSLGLFFKTVFFEEIAIFGQLST
jgi:hypothetical protein